MAPQTIPTGAPRSTPEHMRKEGTGHVQSTRASAVVPVSPPVMMASELTGRCRHHAPGGTGGTVTGTLRAGDTTLL